MFTHDERDEGGYSVEAVSSPRSFIYTEKCQRFNDVSWEEYHGYRLTSVHTKLLTHIPIAIFRKTAAWLQFCRFGPVLEDRIGSFGNSGSTACDALELFTRMIFPQFASEGGINCVDIVPSSYTSMCLQVKTRTDGARSKKIHFCFVIDRIVTLVNIELQHPPIAGLIENDIDGLMCLLQRLDVLPSTLSHRWC
jgi:hypothetical protein